MNNGLAKEAASLTADDILDILERNVPSGRPGRRFLFREFPLEAGKRGKSRYRIDGLFIETLDGGSARRTAYEIKISREDFQRELADPEKRRRAMRIADFFFFAVPEGLVQPDEVPEECGLIWMRPEGQAPTIMKMSKIQKAPVPDWPLTIDLLRHAFALGQEDAAKREPISVWPEVEGLAEIIADPFALDAEKIDVLEALTKQLHQHGRRAEAKRILEFKTGLSRFIDEGESLLAAEHRLNSVT